MNTKELKTLLQETIESSIVVKLVNLGFKWKKGL